MKSSKDKKQAKNAEYIHMDNTMTDDEKIAFLQQQVMGLQAENDNLKRKLELTQRTGSVAGQTGKLWLDQLQQVMNERDDAIAELEQVKDDVAHKFKLSYENMIANEKVANDYWNDEQIAEDISQSLLGRVAWKAFDMIQNTLNRIERNNLDPRIKKQIEISGNADVKNNIGLTLDKLEHMNWTTANYALGIDLANQFRTIVKNKHIAAYEIMENLRLHGKAPMKIVEHFPETYLKIFRRNGIKYKRLRVALLRGHECESMTQEAVAEKHIVSIETIKLDRRIYLQVKELADNPPEWLAKILEANEDENSAA